MKTTWWMGVLLLGFNVASAQELEPRAFSPSPIGTTFVLGGFGTSEGGILFDPALDIDNVQADLWTATTGLGHTFSLLGRQARGLAVLPFAWGSVAGNVGTQAQRQDLAGLADPRFKLSVGLLGAPALTLDEFSRTPRRTAIGAGLTVVPPWGQYPLANSSILAITAGPSSPSSASPIRVAAGRSTGRSVCGSSRPTPRTILDTRRSARNR